MTRMLMRFWRSNKSLIAFLALMVLFRSAVADWNVVPSGSMLPTIREGDRIHAFDLASTQGVYLNGHAVRRVDMQDHGTVLLLGKGTSAVRLIWHRVQ